MELIVDIDGYIHEVYTKKDIQDVIKKIDDEWEISWNCDYRGGFKDGCQRAVQIIKDNLLQ